MEAPSETKNPNLNTVTTDRNSKAKGKSSSFEFCKVCKLNHNQGRGHNYFPNHVKSLSSFLSRFQSKLSDVRFFLKNPSILRPELASRNRIWCVFCDSDVTEHGSSFACEKAISHLASADHLKNLKSFMWKHGGGMDRIDRFRVSEADLAKYEKKCISLKNGGGSEQSHGPLVEPSNDIHNELKFDYVDNFNRDKLSFPNGVLPLQNHTNEKYQVCHSDMPGGTATSTSSSHNKSLLLDSDANHSNNIRGLQKLVRLSFTTNGSDAGNVHSGAPPPWFDTTNGSHLDPVIKPVKSKLNPKRVGAAWAEKRKMEMEMERRGEFPTNRFDASWLPNFGRVWQSGSRKDSRKEFQVEIKKPIKDEDQSDSSLQLQPYISKRMRRDANE